MWFSLPEKQLHQPAAVFSDLFFQYEARKSNGFVTTDAGRFLAFQVFLFYPHYAFFILLVISYIKGGWKEATPLFLHTFL